MSRPDDGSFGGAPSTEAAVPPAWYRLTGEDSLAETRGASPLIYLLLGAAATSAFLRQYKAAAVIGAVLLINAVIGFVQEHRAERSLRALGRMLVPLARVRRDGREADVESSRLVPGDVVLLASGTRVPALLLQLAVLSVPALEWVLGTVPFSPAALGRAALTAATVFAAVEIDKLFARVGARPQRGAALLFATPRDSRKFRNLRANPRVSLLLDTRGERDRDYATAEAITVVGRARVLRAGSDAWREAGRALRAKHPTLAAFLEAATTALVRVEIEEAVHVVGFQRVTTWRPDP